MISSASLRRAVAPGSYLVMSHCINEDRKTEAAAVTELYQSTSDPGITYRTRAQFHKLFSDWELLDPGVAWIPRWLPDWPDEVGTDPASLNYAGGVARKNPS